MSCPFKPATPLQRFEKKVSQSKDTIDAANAGGIDETPDNNEMAVFTPKSSSTPEAFLSSVTNQNKQVFDALRVECANIEANIADAEASVLNKDRLAFVIRSSEIEYSQMHNNLVSCS